MKVRLSVYSAKPYQREFTINEVAGDHLIDEVSELQTELVYLLNYKLLKGKILGFCLSQVSLEEAKH